jgi:alpha-D-ribose 1-methylphosphonate 5-triphosphate synthase subunit PhnH
MPTSPSNAAALTPGFADPVLHSQRAFRTLMDALAGPGQWLELVDRVVPPAGLSGAAAVTLLTLADTDTPVWLPPAIATGEAMAWLRFHCNCPFADRPADAAFALVLGDDPSMPQLAAFAIGTDRFPDQSTTVLVQCRARVGGAPVRLTGPGIETAREIGPAGLRPSFWQEVAGNARQYPLGVDVLLLDAVAVLGLPRSTAITTVAGGLG